MNCVNWMVTLRTITFCHTHNQCRMLYSFFASELRSEQRYFAMYHSTTEEKVKDEILHSVSDPGGWVRILFCTVAFGMGLNGKNITRVFHFGPSQYYVDDYVQESGRGGEACHAIMVCYNGCRRQKSSEEISQKYKSSGLQITWKGLITFTSDCPHTKWRVLLNYQCAKAFDISVPKSWSENECAEKD